jgi:stage V sporulation protein B
MSSSVLIKGTLILTMAALVSRVLGVAQRIPLQRILGDEGMASYGIAYNIYGILLIIATVGIPSALSKQIAEYHAVGQYGEAERVYRASRDFSLVAGVAAAGFLYMIAPFYAVHISHDPDAVLAIRAIAPALLLFPLISIMRGYFQGMQLMGPTGLSQISEQILRVGTALVLSFFLIEAGYSMEAAVAGASFGAVAGSVGAVLILFIYYWRSRAVRLTRVKVQQRTPRREIYRKLLKNSIPISLASTAIPLIYFIDSSTVIALLKGQVGYEEAKHTLGILTGRAQALAGIPPILAIAMSSAVLPAVASAYSKKNMAAVSRTSSLSLRLTLLTGAPLALFLTVAAFPVNGLLFGNTEGSWIVAALCISSIFQIMMLTSTAILQGLGGAGMTMKHVIIGVWVKAILNFVLAAYFGIFGIVLATALGFMVILGLNVVSIRRLITLQVLGARWKGFLAASLLMTAAAWLAYMGLESWLPSGWPGFVRYALLCAGSGLVGFGMYAVVLLRLRGIVEDDMSYLPARVRRLVIRN